MKKPRASLSNDPADPIDEAEEPDPDDQGDLEAEKTILEAEEDGESAASILGAILTHSINQIDQKPMMKEPLPNDDSKIQEAKSLAQVKNTLLWLSQHAPDSPTSYDPEASDVPFEVRVRMEYEKLYALFSQQRKQYQSLVKTFWDMKNEIEVNNSKVEAALRMSQNDRVTISGLKKELKKAWKVVAIADEKELKSKDTIERLKIEVENIRGVAMMANPSKSDKPSNTGAYSKLMEDNVDLEKTVARLQKEKDEVAQSLQVALSDIRILRRETDDLNAKIEGKEVEKSTLIAALENVKSLLESNRIDLDRESKLRVHLEILLQKSSDANAKLDQDIAAKVSEFKSLKESSVRLELQIKDDKLKAEKEQVERETDLKRMRAVQEDLENRLREEKSKRSQMVEAEVARQWQVDAWKALEDLKEERKSRDLLIRQIKSLEEAKTAAEVERDMASAQGHVLDRESDSYKNQIAENERQIEALKRERDTAQKNFVKATGATQRQMNFAKLTEHEKHTLEEEMAAFKEEAAKMRKLIFSLEKERDRNMEEYRKSEEKVQGKDEDLKRKSIIISDLHKKIIEAEKRLREQQVLYENVRADRNVYSKNLVESQDEITEIKRKLKITGHQIEQLKEEITAKDAEKEKDSLVVQISRLQNHLSDSQKSIQNHLAEENKLRHVIAETDLSKQKISKEYDAAISERDVLGNQLIHRNEELALLVEKIKIQTSTLQKGEIQYIERLEDIRVLKLEIKKLRREKAILQTETQNVLSLRNEIFKLNKEILRERTRVKVLEEELESPMNIHRWRKLAGSDPTTFELISKIQVLQKRLISKTEEVVEKEATIKQKEGLYNQVKLLLQRQPGPEVLVELRNVKENVKCKIRECKSLASELNLYHSQVNEYKYEIQKVNKDLQDLKKKYYHQKKREREFGSTKVLVQGQIEKPEGFESNKSQSPMKPKIFPPLLPHLPSAATRFNGGGFKFVVNDLKEKPTENSIRQKTI